DKHTLQYLHRSFSSRTDGPEFTAAVLVDGEEVVYYNSTISKAIPKTEWIKKIQADYWNRETRIHQRHQDILNFNLKAVMRRINQAGGYHTLQRMYSCELHGDATTKGHMQYCYDGEDFLSLNLKTGTWTAVKPEAESFIKTWESTGRGAAYWKSYIEKECMDWLKKFVSCGGEDLKRKGDKHELKRQENCTCMVQHNSLNETLIKEVPKGGGQAEGLGAVWIGVITVVIAVIAIVAGLVVWKKIISGFRPVSQNSNC
ncbi:H-2 class I histocompatibility antigen, Q10 alpha chain-like isoform X2, partial [Clarias magur]